MMKKSNSTKKTLYAIIGLVVVFLVAYFIASDEVLNSYEKYNITASTSKQVGMGLNTFYLLAASAVIAVIYSEFSKAFGK